MGLYAELRGFVLAHRSCGVLRGDAESLTATGYRVWITCPCGPPSSAGVRRRMRDEDLLRSGLLAFEP